MTLPGTTLGSVHYFSPEQARGEPATERSDIYSLGVVLFEMLTGRRPFEGDSAASIAMARLTPPVPMPSAVRAGIPPVLEAICRKALAIDPADRFSSARGDGRRARGRPGGPRRRRACRPRGAAGRWPPGAAATVAAGVARANPAADPVRRRRLRRRRARRSTAAAGRAPPRRRAAVAGRPRRWRRPAVRGPGSPACSASAILVVVGFLVFQLLTGGATPPARPRSSSRTSSARPSTRRKPLADATGVVLQADRVRQEQRPARGHDHRPGSGRRTPRSTRAPRSTSRS